MSGTISYWLAPVYFCDIAVGISPKLHIRCILPVLITKFDNKLIFYVVFNRIYRKTALDEVSKALFIEYLLNLCGVTAAGHITA